MSLETPQEVNFFREGSSHAREKRTPEVQINGIRKQDKRHILNFLDYAILKKLFITTSTTLKLDFLV
ncbi:hypothetical protein IT80_05865 [Listeria monocytogenes]|nr:hypothetical protein [Listeria monocytogenes]EAD6505233.1 hypothetical protein [Listeria monocytogenes]